MIGITQIKVKGFKIFYTTCVVHIRSFTAFQEFLQRLKKSLFGRG
jgi:hypothetical protein